MAAAKKGGKAASAATGGKNKNGGSSSKGNKSKQHVFTTEDKEDSSWPQNGSTRTAATTQPSIFSKIKQQHEKLLTALVFLILGLLTPPCLLTTPRRSKPTVQQQQQSTTLSSSSSSDASDTSTFDSPQERRSLSASETTTTEEEQIAAPEVLADEDTTAMSSSSSSSKPQFPCTDEVLESFWHEDPVPGLHLICFDTDDTDNNPPRNLELRFYRNAVKLPKPSSSVNLPLPLPFMDLQTLIESELGVKKKKRDDFQSWALFSPTGLKLATATDEKEKEFVRHVALTWGMALLYEGGQWQWPGVRIGFTRQVDLWNGVGEDLVPAAARQLQEKNTTSTVTLETLSLIPLIFSVQGFVSDEECSHIQQEATPHLARSGVTLMDADAGRPASDFRTSSNTFLDATGGDATLEALDYRTASLVRVPRNHQETIQVLRYEQGQRYDAHLDYFEPSLYKNDANTLQLIRHGRRNRFATVFMYFSSVAGGGETIFPRFNRSRESSSLNDCDTGLKVTPERGKVIIFYSMRADGALDSNSLHGACPVEEGIKWAGNKWVWNEPVHFVPS